MDIMYGDTVVEEIKSNNWKRMHGVPLKAHPRLNGYRICSVRLDNRYVSKRSRKKQKKIRFRGCFFYQITEAGLHDNPKLKRIYHRYGAWRKKLRKKIIYTVDISCEIR